jgi:hypothetical protein
LQSYWLEGVDLGGCVYALPKTRRKLTPLQDGGVQSLPKCPYVDSPGLNAQVKKTHDRSHM